MKKFFLSFSFSHYITRVPVSTMDDGEVMETAMGKMHYKLTGKGPVLFFMHGGPGGIDQAFFLDGMIEECYSILSVFDFDISFCSKGEAIFQL